MKNTKKSEIGLTIIDLINSEILNYSNDNNNEYYCSQKSENANQKIHNLLDKHLFEWEKDDEYVEYCLKGTPIENYNFLISRILLHMSIDALKNGNAELISKLHTIISEMLIDDEMPNRPVFEKLGNKMFKHLQKNSAKM